MKKRVWLSICLLLAVVILTSRQTRQADHARARTGTRPATSALPGSPDASSATPSATGLGSVAPTNIVAAGNAGAGFGASSFNTTGKNNDPMRRSDKCFKTFFHVRHDDQCVDDWVR